MNYLLAVFDEHISEDANALCNSLCERSLRLYFTQNKDLVTPLKSEEFYEERVSEAMRQIGLID
jgi:hypothetical protein